MGNLAYKELKAEVEINDLKKINKNYKIKTVNENIYGKIILYALLLLTFAIGYINSITQKTNCSIKIEKLITEEQNLQADVNKLVSEYDIAIDLNEVEKRAKKQLDMKIMDEIKYVKFN